VAFVVREDFQSMGIASHLLATMEKIAKANNYKSFLATVLRENTAMLHVFKKRYPHARTTISSGSDVSIHMDFNDAVETAAGTGHRKDNDELCVCPLPNEK
jgi:ribosomal protein S18 acetylase RimI-like enzyme